MNQNNQVVDSYSNEYTYQPNNPSYYYASHPSQSNAQNKQVPRIPPKHQNQSEDIASSEEGEDETGVAASSGNKSVPAVLDKEAKKEKSRQSAKDCRDKKKVYIETIEGRIVKMEAQIRSCYHRNQWYTKLIAEMVKKNPELQSIINEYNKKWIDEEEKRAKETALMDTKNKIKGGKKRYV